MNISKIHTADDGNHNHTIPLSVIVTTKNEASNIKRCLSSVQGFGEVIVVDSHSSDSTLDIAENLGAKTYNFKWNGKYPKKRQWCLDNIKTKHEWIFFVDADEVLTGELIREIEEIFTRPDLDKFAGFFVRGNYVWEGRVLKYGLKNNKLALINKDKMEFPLIDDLAISGMGEIEGHYQPIIKPNNNKYKIGQLSRPLLHYAYEDKKSWKKRHLGYALWESEMNKKGAWPQDPVIWREYAKRFIRSTSLRPYIYFLYSYILKFGFLDGKAGFSFALSRAEYAALIVAMMKK